MHIISILISGLLFSFLSMHAWNGSLGISSIIVLPISILTFVYGRRKLTPTHKTTLTFCAKFLMTIVGIIALLRHPIETDVQEVIDGTAIVSIQSPKEQDISIILYNQEQQSQSLFIYIPKGKSTHSLHFISSANDHMADGIYRIRIPENSARTISKLPIYSAVHQYIDQVDRTTFLLFAICAMAIKFVGVMSSAYAWHLLLRGQGIVQPYFQSTLTAFLIGRFIGTFLPSTIGLDGYTFYEAARYSNQNTRVAIAKILEKFIGITGLFLGMFLTLPFGYQVIVDVTQTIENPNAAPLLAGAIALISGGISLIVIVGLLYPHLLRLFVQKTSRFLPSKLSTLITSFTDAVFAYEGKFSLVLTILFAKFITHFTTAIVYFFTALAIGAITWGIGAFWPIVFGSNIQILATILSPTIAGEGAREAFQALLLEKRLGGIPQAVLSGALGFVAAEAATMWGGAFWWTRKDTWRPTFMLVDDKQVDYSWLEEDTMSVLATGDIP